MRTIRPLSVAAATLAVGVVGFATGDPPTEYKSPYSVKHTHPLKELIGDIEAGARGDPREESSVPFREWDSKGVREKWGSWGPPARHYPAPEAKIAEKPAAWKRERAVAVAMRYVGYGYQHHHIPDWEPPRGWPRQEAAGRDGKGLDCSNFLSFVYNQGFGVKPNSGIKEMAADVREVPGPGGRPHRVELIDNPGSYEGWRKALKTGDLLFIKGKADGPVTHVVMWVGAIGQSPGGEPLIIDSHGQGVVDGNGAHIPAGVRLRPFREKSWYAKDASHAVRVLTGE